MLNRLTLKINKRTITRAKKLASIRKTSISEMVENYLKLITNDGTEKIQITPLVKSIAGAAKFTKDYDCKKEYINYVIEKYK